jgi:hypothetical protein
MPIVTIKATINQYRLCTLTKKEFAVAVGIIRDMIAEEIAADLNMGVSTVRGHLTQIYEKCFISGKPTEKKKKFFTEYRDDVLFLYKLIGENIDSWLRTPKLPLDPVTENLLNAIIKERQEKIAAGIPIDEDYDPNFEPCLYEKQLDEYLREHWREYVGKLWIK